VWKFEKKSVFESCCARGRTHTYLWARRPEAWAIVDHAFGMNTKSGLDILGPHYIDMGGFGMFKKRG
jgi:hypothetical protein